MSTTYGQTRTGGHRALLWILTLASCVAVVLATISIGVEQVLLNTDRWVDTVGPLASNPGVQASLADAAATQATTALDAQIQSLPGPLQRLAAPAGSGLNAFISEQAQNLVQSPQFAQVWVEVNRTGHEALVQLLRGELAGGTVTIADGDLQLNLLALMPALVERVQQLPVNLMPTPPTTDFGYINLAPAGPLANAQQLVQLLDRTTWALALAAVVLTGVTLVISADRRLTTLRLGLGVAIGMLLAGLGLLLVQGRIVNAVADRPISGALQAALSAVLMSLGQFLLVVLIAAAVVSLVAFVAGRSTSHKASV